MSQQNVQALQGTLAPQITPRNNTISPVYLGLFVIASAISLVAVFGFPTNFTWWAFSLTLSTLIATSLPIITIYQESAVNQDFLQDENFPNILGPEPVGAFTVQEFRHASAAYLNIINRGRRHYVGRADAFSTFSWTALIGTNNSNEAWVLGSSFTNFVLFVKYALFLFLWQVLKWDGLVFSWFWYCAYLFVLHICLWLVRPLLWIVRNTLNIIANIFSFIWRWLVGPIIRPIARLFWYIARFVLRLIFSNILSAPLRFLGRHPYYSSLLVLVLTWVMFYKLFDQSMSFLYCDPCQDTGVGLFSWPPLSYLSTAMSFFYCWRRSEFRRSARENVIMYGNLTEITSDIANPLLDYGLLRSVSEEADDGARILEAFTKNKPARSVTKLQTNLDDFNTFLRAFIILRKESLDETSKTLPALREKIEAVQDTRVNGWHAEYGLEKGWQRIWGVDKGWRAMAVPHSELSIQYEQRLAKSYNITANFLEKMQDGKTRINKLRELLALSLLLPQASSSPKYNSGRTCETFASVTESNCKEMRTFQMALKKWKYQSFQQNLLWFQDRVNSIEEVLQRSLDRQDLLREGMVERGGKKVNQSMECETDLRGKSLRIQELEKKVRRQSDHMVSVIAGL